MSINLNKLYFFLLNFVFQNVIFTPKYTETRMLDMLHELVENEHLQSVVDHIYPAQNIELAITHKMSTDAIGNTILKFT